ncbi:homing endonuclease associated repeat-containing protein [Thermoactinomyces sp. DSM 45892]|uniref:homing endonuclease associated repeat-containing protein n=1 Tax=Thermoactinomyces sp. DSM 45892 TaxID=1882753 RepID=UPI00089685B7|nr:helix-turn-helix domain-containing protein [Thermoactinomyces sp. DSM 45892]SDY85627.1 hypothetical protein SAMN05444416_10986 [Thermoactinomyces sp. DSM 45892]
MSRKQALMEIEKRISSFDGTKNKTDELEFLQSLRQLLGPKKLDRFTPNFDLLSSENEMHVKLTNRLKQILLQIEIDGTRIPRKNLADAGGLSRPLVSQYLGNGVVPSLEAAYYLKEVFNCDIEDLFEEKITFVPIKPRDKKTSFHSKDLSHQVLIEELQQWAKDNNTESPMIKDVPEPLSRKGIYHFGSWTDFVLAAGLKPKRNRKSQSK